MQTNIRRVTMICMSVGSECLAGDEAANPGRPRRARSGAASKADDQDAGSLEARKLEARWPNESPIGQTSAAAVPLRWSALGGDARGTNAKAGKITARPANGRNLSERAHRPTG